MSLCLGVCCMLFGGVCLGLVYVLLLVVCCLPHDGRCSMFVGDCLLFIVYCLLLFYDSCWLFVVCLVVW